MKELVSSCLALLVGLIFSIGWLLFADKPTAIEPISFSSPVIKGDEDIMKEKQYGTCVSAPMKGLRWNVDWERAEEVACYNRDFAEPRFYFNKLSKFTQEFQNSRQSIQFFDSVTGKLLFTAPIGRSFEEFLKETEAHGWPSFRNEEVNWQNVRILEDGEMVSVDGTHLGHNLPDYKGNRYCINLVSIAGNNKK